MNTRSGTLNVHPLRATLARNLEGQQKLWRGDLHVLGHALCDNVAELDRQNVLTVVVQSMWWDCWCGCRGGSVGSGSGNCGGGSGGYVDVVVVQVAVWLLAVVAPVVVAGSGCGWWWLL